MPAARFRLEPGRPPAPPGLDSVRADLGVPEGFPPEVLAAAEAAAAKAPGDQHADATSVPLVTIDPPGSRDLDQAFHAERVGSGWRVHYAIADVAWFVRPGDPVDLEARARGVTLYSPDQRTPLYPPVLSEGAASLLPDVDRPALLWRIELEPDGAVTSYDVRRSLVRSRVKLSYAEVQGELEEGGAAEPLVLLREIGTALLEQERARGGVHLPTPEQEAVPDGAGWALALRAPLPVEDWNAQISLLTGRCAAEAMLGAGIGLLRTLPSPAQESVASLRRSSLALGVPWPDDQRYPEWVRSLDVADPRHAALAVLATRLLRGAGYIAFTDGRPKAADALHAAIAAPYAHVTAPLRRLADRYANRVVLAVCAGHRPADEVVEALPLMPDLMGDAARREHSLERAMLDFVEATVLASRCGETFDATVVELAGDGSRGVVQIADPFGARTGRGAWSGARRGPLRDAGVGGPAQPDGAVPDSVTPSSAPSRSAAAVRAS